MKLYLYIIQRFLVMLLLMFGVSLLVFILMRGIASPTFSLAGYVVLEQTNAQRLQIAQTLGFATQSCPSYQAYVSQIPSCIIPWYEQYIPWLQSIISGVSISALAGVSISGVTSANEWTPFIAELPNTIELVIISAIVSLLIAISLGIYSASHPNGVIDNVIRVFALGLSSIPSYVLGAFLIILIGFNPIMVGGKLGPIFPSAKAIYECAICYTNIGFIQPYTGFPLLDSLLSGNFPYFWDTLLSLVLPIVTLSLVFLGPLYRHTRTSMVTVLSQEYIQFARSKGLTERVVIYRHAFRNAVQPIVTYAGVMVALLINNVIIVEVVFQLQGLGSIYEQALHFFDANLFADIALVAAFFVVMMNLVVDIMHGILDPRIRKSRN